MIEQATIDVILQQADRIAKRYKRRCWWVSEEDVRQEAIEAQLRAVPKFDEQWGRPLCAYLWRAAFIAARRSVLKASAPVTAHYRLDVLIGLQRAPITELTESAYSAQGGDNAERAGRVLTRVVESLGEKEAALVVGAWVEGWTPEEIAEANGVEPRRVRFALRVLEGKLQRDPILRTMWKELIR